MIVIGLGQDVKLKPKSSSTINTKVDNSFKCKAYKLKFKYECKSDSDFSYPVLQGKNF